MYAYKNIREKAGKIKSGHLSLQENVRQFLAGIEEKKQLNAFNEVYSEEAARNAEEIEKKIRSGIGGKLAGAVIAVKDVLAIKDKTLTCSSKILQNFTSVYTATSIQKLINEDAIIIGKTNCDEFAMGSSNENSAFGNVLNPIDETRVPGGSSGGSAAALKAGLCDAAIGTDTGGSVRQPAAFCGLYGMKPTYGRISRYGLTAFASSFDTVGIFSNNLDDSALILDVMSGNDPLDSTSATTVYQNLFPLPEGGMDLRFGIPSEYLNEGMDDDIQQEMRSLIGKLKDSGINISNISLPHTRYTVPAYYILTTAEASANLSRYDGIRFGFRSPEPSSLNEMYTNTRTAGFGEEVKRRIMLGTYVLSAGYYDAYYKKAQKVRRLIKQDFDNAFKEVDIIITPTTPTTAFRIGEKMNDPVRMYLSDIFTTSANLAGIPALNVPIWGEKNKLPVGIQLMANQFNEALLFKAGQLIITPH